MSTTMPKKLGARAQGELPPNRIRVQKTFTISDDTIVRLDELSESLELPVSRVVDRAVRELWERIEQGKG